ncbi:MULTISPECIES: hypothetical protein [Bacillati]|uniref:hypothetical protein n=1 Tax=Bacillati TaxID=1783272 RepID=UPI0036678958
MDSAKKALLFGAGLFLTIALITLFVIIYSTASDASKAAQNEFTSLQTELSEQTYLVYDNTTVSGSQVINAIRKFEGQDIGIKVATGKGNTSWYIKNASDPNNLTAASGSTSGATTETNPAYINPSGNFSAKVTRDGNKVIRAIEFTQE